MPQLIRLMSRCGRETPVLDYDLVDILRAMAWHDRNKVIGRTWLIAELDMETYLDDASGELFLFGESWFPGSRLQENGLLVLGLLVPGQMLLEKAALSHQVETAFLYRVKNDDEPVRVDELPALGAMEYQATNVDLEIRCYDFGGFEVFTEDDAIIAALARRFAQTEIVVA